MGRVPAVKTIASGRYGSWETKDEDEAVVYYRMQSDKKAKSLLIFVTVTTDFPHPNTLVHCSAVLSLYPLPFLLPYCRRPPHPLHRPPVSAVLPRSKGLFEGALHRRPFCPSHSKPNATGSEIFAIRQFLSEALVSETAFCFPFSRTGRIDFPSQFTLWWCHFLQNFLSPLRFVYILLNVGTTALYFTFLTF